MSDGKQQKPIVMIAVTISGYIYLLQEGKVLFRLHPADAPQIAETLAVSALRAHAIMMIQKVMAEEETKTDAKPIIQ